jgi:16S rRNA (uracil1498-N3)-methyltransferase
MTRRRWIADEVTQNRAALTGPHAEHLARVLRAQVGQEFDIATGSAIRRGRITSISDTRVEFELAEAISAATLPDLTLLLAIFKFDRMEWAIEKATELGVRRIVPVIARRTDAHLASAANKRFDRWQRLAHQASEQSRRPATPELASPIKVSEAVAISATTRILLAETETQHKLLDRLESHQPEASLALAIGPEGGWSPDEITTFTTAGFLPASLGPTILRAETAAIAAVAIALSQLT